MQSDFELAEIGGNNNNYQQHFIMDTGSSSCPSLLLPIFNPQKPNHHHHFHQQHHQPQPQQTYHHHHINHLSHSHYLQALRQQEEQQEGRLNFKLGLNESSGNGESALLCAAGLLGENGVDPPTHHLGFKSWQTQDFCGIRKEPMCWKPLEAAKQRHSNEGEICKELESKYRLYGELEAIYSLAKLGETNQTGSGSALTGENSPKDVNFSVPFSNELHGLNAAPTAGVRVDNGSEASMGEEVLMRKTQKKRKRRVKEKLGSMTRFFEGLVKGVVDHQESLHNKYLELIERMDKERREREAAWRFQEAENHKREAIARVHEQALASSREALIVSYIEKITGQRVTLPSRQTPLLLESDHILNEPGEELTSSKIDHSNSRWPQSEVEALILVRSSVEPKFLEPGLKGPVWEEVSALMASVGYQRSAKRCKEKWESMNKYFKKTKDSARERPHHSKTSSYFNQLDQLYLKIPITGPSNYYNKPSVSMDAGIQRQGYSELLETCIAGREAGVTHNLLNGNFKIPEMVSNRLDFDGTIAKRVEHAQGGHGKEEENCEIDENMDEKEDTDDDDCSDEWGRA